MEEFLRELLHFQHFRQFINCRIERLKSKKQERDLFDSEVLLYEDGGWGPRMWAEPGWGSRLVTEMWPPFYSDTRR